MKTILKNTGIILVAIICFWSCEPELAEPAAFRSSALFFVPDTTSRTEVRGVYYVAESVPYRGAVDWVHGDSLRGGGTIPEWLDSLELVIRPVWSFGEWLGFESEEYRFSEVVKYADDPADWERAVIAGSGVCCQYVTEVERVWSEGGKHYIRFVPKTDFWNCMEYEDREGDEAFRYKLLLLPD